jgi:hypothetical protein
MPTKKFWYILFGVCCLVVACSPNKPNGVYYQGTQKTGSRPMIEALYIEGDAKVGSAFDLIMIIQQSDTADENNVLFSEFFSSGQYERAYQEIVKIISGSLTQTLPAKADEKVEHRVRLCIRRPGLVVINVHAAAQNFVDINNGGSSLGISELYIYSTETEFSAGDYYKVVAYPNGTANAIKQNGELPDYNKTTATIDTTAIFYTPPPTPTISAESCQ